MSERAKRLVNDAYYSPEALALECCKRLAHLIPTPATILEPTAGGGAFVKAARAAWPGAMIEAEDVDPSCEAPCRAAGAHVFLKARPLEENSSTQFRLIVGNPPYQDVEEHVRKALARLRWRAHAAFLLRLSFLEPTRKRLDLPAWRWALPVAGRARFRADRNGSDNVGSVLLVWENGHTGAGEWLAPITWNRKPQEGSNS